MNPLTFPDVYYTVVSNSLNELLPFSARSAHSQCLEAFLHYMQLSPNQFYEHGYFLVQYNFKSGLRRAII